MFTGVRCECELSVSLLQLLSSDIFSRGVRAQASNSAGYWQGYSVAACFVVWVLASLVGIRRLRLINNNVL